MRSMGGLTESIECSPEEYEAFRRFVSIHHRVPFHGENIFQPGSVPIKAAKDTDRVDKLIKARLFKKYKEIPKKRVYEPRPEIIPDEPKKITRPAAEYSNSTPDNASHYSRVKL